MPTTSVVSMLSLLPRRNAGVVLALSMIVLIGAAACTQVGDGSSATTRAGKCGNGDSSANGQNDPQSGYGINDIIDDNGPEKDHGPAACLTPHDEIAAQTRITVEPVTTENVGTPAEPRSSCTFIVDDLQDEFDIGHWLRSTTPMDTATWTVKRDAEAAAPEAPAPWTQQLVQTANAVDATPAASNQTPEPTDTIRSPMPIAETHLLPPAPQQSVAEMPEDHTPIWVAHTEPMPVEPVAATVSVEPINTTAPVAQATAALKPRTAAAPPQVPTSTFPRARTGATAATVSLALQIATLACICITLVFAYFVSRGSDAAGRSARAFTIATGFVLCVGGAVSLLVGACWMGSQSLASAVGDSALAGQMRLVIVALTGMGLGVVAAMGYARSVHAPLNQMIAALRAAATGDFQQPPINATTRNELGEVARAADKIVASMKDAITEVSISSLDLAAAAGEIVAGTKEASSSVGQVAQRCGETVASANEAGRYADQSNQAVSQTAAAFEIIDRSVEAGARSVRSVDEHGRNIAQIVRVIDDIADRTHLVALNASIEAAKSGTQGRGLGQIAEEVRRLAERAQVATEEVATAVEAIRRESLAATNQIEAGSAQIKHTAEINARAGSDLALMAKAANSVAGAVKSISDVAEDAGAGAIQAATAADQLSSKAEDLKSVVGRFRLDTGRFLKYASGSRVAGAPVRP